MQLLENARSFCTDTKDNAWVTTPKRTMASFSSYFAELRRKKPSDFIPAAVRRRWSFHRKRRKTGSKSSFESSIEEESRSVEDDSSAPGEDLWIVEVGRAAVNELHRRGKVRYKEE